MSRRAVLIVVVVCVGIGLALFAATPAGAQFQPAHFELAQLETKAYAPENLHQLNLPARRQVIEREYADQSGGRRIPDDQLQFYLDQIRLQRWTFSQISADIAQSLRGGGRPPPHPPGGDGEVVCESRDHGFRECSTPFRGRARLQRQLSDTRCIEGRNWGSRRGLVWVDEGCRAAFVGDRGGGRPPYPGDGYTVTCASRDGHFQSCAWPSGYGRPRLVEQLSKAECRYGRSWGYDSRRGLWVDEGCRARFDAR